MFWKLELVKCTGEYQEQVYVIENTEFDKI